jgi:ABC-2 type transport system ATP-binding protein
MNVIEGSDVARRYGKRWAIRHLDLGIPEGAVVGLVGPNGAGKSTLLHLLTGLIQPTEGTISVLGGRPGQARVLPDVAFVAQDAPLPRRARLGELVAMAGAMNVRWNSRVVRDRCDELGLNDRQPLATLSGGQRVQFALALALAKQPRLLLLDEPVASLDPLARRTFLQALMTAVAEGDLTVVFSTHLLDDLERTCDYLVVLGQGTLRLADPIEDIVRRHTVLVGPVGRALPAEVTPVRTDSSTPRHQQLVCMDRAIADPAWQQLTPSLEEIVLAYLAVEQPPAWRLQAV